MAVKRRAKPVRRKKPPGHRSGLERKTAKYLDSLGIPYTYESEKIPYIVPEKKRTYLPDFIVTTKSGKKIYIEDKGRLTPQDREKMLLVIKQHPDLDIRMVLMRNNKLRKGSKTSYADWCKKHRIKYHVSSLGQPPLAWLEE